MAFWLILLDYNLIDYNSLNHYGLILFLITNSVIPAFIYANRNPRYFLNIGSLLLTVVFFQNISIFFDGPLAASHSELARLEFSQLSMTYALVVIVFVLDLMKINIAKYQLNHNTRQLDLERQVAEKTKLLERRAAEKQLMYEQATQDSVKLKQIIDSFPDLIWMLDPDGLYLAVHSQLEAYFNKPSAEIVGNTDYELMDKEHADLVVAMDKEAEESGKSIVITETIFSPESGRNEMFETTKNPTYLADGTLLGVIGISRNITDRQLAEETLATKTADLISREKNLRMFVDSAPIGIAKTVWMGHF
ncbi:MAG: PAS domain S-box-containing protein [Cyclobacteriaceae bacterium]|jgi:PAS domain S-box-containing protein